MKTNNIFKIFFLLILAASAGLVFGILLTIETQTPTKYYYQLRYFVRDSLGLEKNWASIPTQEQSRGARVRDCPPPERTLVLVVGGQSNASNAIPVKYNPKGDVSVWFDGKCFEASDPLLGSTSENGSIWSALGDRLEEELKSPILIIAGAVGGTQFSDFLDRRSGYYDALIKRVSDARNAGYIPNITLWHQGETDANAERNLESLKVDVANLTDQLLIDIPSAPLYLFQASRCIGPYRVNGVPGVINVIQQVAKANPDIIMGMNTDILGRNYRWDTCHFNTIARDAIISEITPELIEHLKNKK